MFLLPSLVCAARFAAPVTMLAVGSICCLAEHSWAQVPTSRRATSQPAEPSFERAIAAWIASDYTDVALLANAAQVVIDGGRPALRHLRDLGKTADPDTARRQARAIQSLIRDVVLGHLERVRDGDLFFAGQFEPLEELQPWSGRILLGLVIDTPTWFPVDLRASVVPALRDLFANGPDADTREALLSIARDEVYEPPAIRSELACAFAQWGDRSLIEPELRELEESSGPCKTSDDLYFVRRLAQLHYRLRDYRAASDRWVAFLRGSEAIDSTPYPFDYYNAACSLSLSGDIRAALTELERCGALLRSESIDESHRIERSLFAADPELRAVRPTRRFQQILVDTFGGESR